MKLFVFIHLLAIFTANGKILPPQLRNHAPLYPPQTGLVQWLEGDSWSNVTARVGAEITFDGTSLIQTNFQAALPSMSVDIVGYDAIDGTYLYSAIKNGKPLYTKSGATYPFIEWNASSNSWFIGHSPIGTYLYFQNTNDTAFPLTTGWESGPDVVSETINLTYTSIWVDAGEFAEVVESELQALPGNTNNILNIYTYSSAPPSYIDTTVTIGPYRGVYTTATP